MRLPQLKIRSLLGVVFLVAFATAALRTADNLGDSGMFGLTSLIFLTAVLSPSFGPITDGPTGRVSHRWAGPTSSPA